MIGKALHLTLMALAWFIRKAFGHVRILIVVLMLGLNIVSLTVSSVGTAMGGLITMGAALVGLSDISTGWNEAKVAKKQVGTLEKQVATLKVEKASLDGNLKRTNTSLELERRTSTSLRKETETLRAETKVIWKGEKVALRDAVQKVVTKVNRKSATIAATNVGSMAGESIPVLGIAVIVASVGFEIKGTCEIMTEMHELQMAIDPSPANDPDLAEVCGMKVPTREELVSQVKRSPHVIWLGMQRTYNNLPDLPEIGLSDRLHRLLDIFN